MICRLRLSLAETRPLGRSGFEVPVFGFGAAHLGELYQKLSDANARARRSKLRGRAVSAISIRHLGMGMASASIGLAKCFDQSHAMMFTISTKVGRIYRRPENLATYRTEPWAGGLPFELEFDYGYDGIMRSYEDSLLAAWRQPRRCVGHP